MVFDKQKNRLTVLCLSNMYPSDKHLTYGIFVKNFVNSLRQNEVDTQIIGMTKKEGRLAKILGYLSYARRIYWNLLSKRYDIIYIHYVLHSILPLLPILIFFRKKVVVNFHGSDLFAEHKSSKRLQNMVQPFIRRRYIRAIVCPSNYFKQCIINKYQFPAEHIFVSPSSGVSKTIFFPTKKMEQAVSKGITFGYVGRMTQDKGVVTLLNAFKKVADSNQHIRLKYYGEGGALAQISAQKEPYEKRISTAKFVQQQQLQKVYSDIDYLVFPTERDGESLGLVMIEALSCGTPVIASNFANCPYVIKDGVNGFLFEKGNSNQLATKMTACLELETSDYSKLSQSAVATADAYETTKVGQELVHFLRSLTRTKK